MYCNRGEEIHGLVSLGECDRFVLYIEDQVKSGVAEELLLILTTVKEKFTEGESLVLHTFAFLQEEWGFSHPILAQNPWSTTIAYLSKEIGTEIELDWHDLDVFILVARLDEGKLPKGYMDNVSHAF
jgi:hypothetical protein